MSEEASHRQVSHTGSLPCAELQLREVELAFGEQKILDGISFDLPPGEITLLRGENGAGKSVLLNVLSGYVRPHSGTVKLRLGKVWVDAATASPGELARMGLGRLWQDIRLFPTMTVLDNVLAATPAGVSHSCTKPSLLRRALGQHRDASSHARALATLDLLGIAERANSSCDMLSVGQMKKVALARLLHMGANLLLLDEPFAGLDAASTEAFAEMLHNLRDEQQKTILMVEHRAEKAIIQLATQVWTLKAGRLTFSGAEHG